MILDNKRQKRPKTFVILKTAIFRNVCFYRFLGHEEIVLSTAQKDSEYLVDPFKLFSDFCHLRKYEKNLANFFSSLERLHFSSKFCVFNNLPGPEKKLL